MRLKSVKQTMDSLRANQAVSIGDVERTQVKLTALVEGGLDNLLVISDFDYTTSKFLGSCGKQLWTTHQLFDNLMMTHNAETYASLCNLRNKYYPIEFCPKMTLEEKTPYMETWWNSAHACIVNSKIRIDSVNEHISRSKIELREGFKDFAWWAETNEVPVIIFSAGIGHIIRVVLHNNLGSVPENLHIISNEFIVEQGVICAFADPLIHTFNKNSSVISHTSSIFQSLRQRCNILLIGDGLGDVHMNVGVAQENCVLRLGFLNHSEKNLESRYLADYDIVMKDLNTFYTVNQLLGTLFEK